MSSIYRAEGCCIGTAENREYLASVSGLERAMRTGAIIEGMVTLCDEKMRLHVDLHCAEGIIDPQEVLYCRAGEERKDIAVITRVGKPVSCKILSIEHCGDRLTVRLSRRLAQESCVREYLSALRPGDIIPAKVTHLEPFGAFLDVGCGVSSLLSVDCISVSRISHPRDRLQLGMSLSVAVKCIQSDTQRLYMTLRELLGTWEENAASFEAGQTVTGIIRSVESYGVFVELAPNLAGLAEVREGCADELRAKIGKSVAVYIKSIVPQRMKIKLVLIDLCCSDPPPARLRYFVDPETVTHIDRWRYSPEGAGKIVETCFQSLSEDR
ncbi:MAG: S1 RNA-binding domain-containing protein [Clostridia bacterium]|nr:S1 RNA-binding domain-containing protein [Clostridia bacterium]